MFSNFSYTLTCKSLAMKISFLIVSLIILISCSNHQKKQVSTTIPFNSINDTSFLKYKKIIEGLKLNYVLYHRELIKIIPPKESELRDNDSKFIQDSITYWKCYHDFFNQDRNFIYWLLSFRNDTSKTGLWFIVPNPLSSTLNECNLSIGLSNSRAAIILIENFLNGEGFTCYECQYDDQYCNFFKYEIIEKFLSDNKEKNIKNLRLAWQKRK